MTTVPQVDLRAAYLSRKAEIDAAIARVLNSGQYILGAEVEAFEREFAAYLGVACAVSVGSGTDSLHLALRAAGIGEDAEVITVAHTAVATVAAIEMCGARPVFADIDPATYTIDPSRIEPLITTRTRALLPVHIYGQAVDLDPLMHLAEHHGLQLIEDCAQSHGAVYRGKKVGGWGLAGCFSFYPTKNLGCFGDGGMVVTNDSAFGERVRLLRQYGWRQRHISEIQGWNSRLDEVQAAILRVRLQHLDEDNSRRRKLAQAYDAALAGAVYTNPKAVRDHVYHLYVIRHTERDALRKWLSERGVQTAIHYRQPVHLQPGYTRLGMGAGSLPETERAACEILSLPLFPELSSSQQEIVIRALQEAERTWKLP